MKVTTQDFRAAKNAVKKIMVEGFICDTSKAHRVAIDTLTARCPNASPELIQDMAWQCVLAAR